MVALGDTHILMYLIFRFYHLRQPLKLIVYCVVGVIIVVVIELSVEWQATHTFIPLRPEVQIEPKILIALWFRE